MRSNLKKQIINFEQEGIKTTLEEVEKIVKIHIPFVLKYFTVKKKIRDQKMICSVDWMGLISSPAIRLMITTQLQKNKP